ncbi:Transposable element P transposase [Amphibalanus amphitrite]|uniref:Transposable element P transposase n=1 Tax=Amphibalanus amphitrite TaxID=1232801 RepID=A0A6A4VXA2_AMPAM|nr:Transposable element P transposase [Amphibalanus amphitrite]
MDVCGTPEETPRGPSELEELQQRVQLLEKRLRARSALHRRRMLQWRREKARLLRELRALRRKAAAADSLEEAGVFSKEQLKRLTTSRRLHWKTNDVATALGLRCVSHKAYCFVREKMMVPLPSLRTLSRWTRGFQVNPGFIEASAAVLDVAVRAMAPLEKLTVVCFDEVALDARFCYDQTADQVLQAGKLQLVMARGLCSGWKQPCFFAYDQPMTPEILTRVIQRLEELGLVVVACVSDMGAENEHMWRKAGVGTNSWIPHPADSNRCYLPGREVQAQAVSVVDRWFDTVNSRVPFADKFERSAYGVSAEAKAALDAALDDMDNLARDARKVTRKQPLGRAGLLPFQRGILRTTASLRGLYEDLQQQAQPEVRYLTTAHLNQDCVENCFAQLRSLCGSNTSPDAVEAHARLKILLMAPSTLVAASSGRPVELEPSSSFLSTGHPLPRDDYVGQLVLDGLDVQLPETNAARSGDLHELEEPMQRVFGETASGTTGCDEAAAAGPSTIEASVYNDAMAFAAGYVAFKCHHIDSGLGVPMDRATAADLAAIPSSWLQTISRGRLYVPSVGWMDAVKAFELNFKLLMGDTASQTRGSSSGSSSSSSRRTPNWTGGWPGSWPVRAYTSACAPSTARDEQCERSGARLGKWRTTPAVANLSMMYKKRVAAKGWLSRTVNKAQELLDADQPDQEALKVIQKELETRLNNLDGLQSDLELMIESESEMLDDIEKAGVFRDSAHSLPASVMAELSHLPMAGRPPPDEPLHVHILVGMDYYWSM